MNKETKNNTKEKGKQHIHRKGNSLMSNGQHFSDNADNNAKKGKFKSKEYKIRIPPEEKIEAIKEKGLVYLKIILIGERLEDVREIIQRSKYFDSVKKGFQDLLFIGVDFYLPRLLVEFDSVSFLVILQIFHLNASNRFKNIRPKFYYGAEHIVAFFRLSDPATLGSAIRLIREGIRYCNNITLLGIKTRDPHMNVITKKDIEEAIKELKKENKDVSISITFVSEDDTNNFDRLIEQFVIGYISKIVEEK
ncbi:MAG: hypothetical protein ACP6IS_06865 [Candidatus Asgardarchaeia archaeon]